MRYAFVKGEDYAPQGEQVTEYPDGFKDWVRDNEAKIRAAQQRGTEPYFIRNNAEVVEGIIKALEESELSGLVPDDFFDEESCFVDIYKPVPKEYIVDYAVEVLRNIADGFDMSDVDAYVAFYNDGTILYTGEMDFDGTLDGKRKLPRTGLIAAMTNGGLLDNIYWAKNAKGMEAIKKYTGYKTVENGVIVNDSKGASLKGSNLKMAISGHQIVGASNITTKEQSHLSNRVRALSKKANLFENLKDIQFSDNLEDGVLMSWRDGTLTISKVKFELSDGSIFCLADELKRAVTKLTKGETLTFNEEYSIEALYHENIHSKAATIFPKTKGKFTLEKGTIDEVIAEACTQLYARENYRNVLDKYGVEAVNYEAIKHNGYGYKETCNLLREHFTKEGKIQVGELINIANETTSGSVILKKKLRASGWSESKIDDLFYILSSYK